MKSRIALIAGLFVVFLATGAQARIEPWPGCDYGPVTRLLGGTDWLVYGCRSDGSLIFVAAPGNPVSPSSMMAFPFEHGGYRVVRTNSEDPRLKAAAQAVSNMSGDQLRAIAAETGAITLPFPKPR